MLQLRSSNRAINAAVGEHGTALTTAIFMREMQLVERLIAHGADVNRLAASRGTALITALAAGLKSEKLYEMVEFLLDKGADINAVGCRQFGSALGQATYMGDMGLVSLLLARGADPFHVGGTYNRTALAGGYSLYPNALDAAQSPGSQAGPELIAVLSKAMKKCSGKSSIPPCPPFPMPYTGSCAMPHTARTSGPPTYVDLESIRNLPEQAVLTAQQADIPCMAPNEELLIQALVQLVIGIRTDTPEFEHYETWIRNDVRYFITQGYDFGLAYAAARVVWKHFNEPDFRYMVTPHRGHWLRIAVKIDEARVNSIYQDNTSTSGQEMIKLPYDVMPRRIWDLKSNRVVEFQTLHSELLAHKAVTEMQFGKPGTTASPPSEVPAYWAITHSWESSMDPIETPINQYQWQVPLPCGLNLERGLRRELLDYGIVYVWLDVMCLRQHTSANQAASQEYVAAVDKIKQEEWKLDVPTIGNIYRAAKGIVRYFNGVGRHFSKEGWDNSRHWLRRAWTLQEIKSESSTINGGIPRNSTGSTPNIMNTLGTVKGIQVSLRRAIRPVLKLAAEVDSPGGCSLYSLAREMSRRDATQATDKVAGLLYLLRPTQLPTYNAKVTNEEAWTRCFHVLPFARKIEVLFDFPYRGDPNQLHDQQWFPTWGQLLEWPEIISDCDYSPAAHAKGHRQLEKKDLADLKELEEVANEETSLFISDIWAISGSRVTLRTHSGETNDYEVRVKNKVYGFYCPYASQEPIETGGSESPRLFTLATPTLEHSSNWVVCEFVKKLKTSCMSMSWDSQQDTSKSNMAQQVSIELEIEVLRKVGVLRTDFCGEILAADGGDGYALRKINALFV